MKTMIQQNLANNILAIGKKSAFLFCSIVTFFSYAASAQTTIENINFDNYINATDNDLANWFSGGNGMVQITSGGIFGGCLTVPDSINWGNEEANYCSKYVGDLAVETNTGICFKYDTTLIDLPGFDRAVSIWLKPSIDFNHYIIASVSHQKRIEILSYSWTNNPGPMLSLVHGNWYQLVLTTTFLPNDSVDIQAVVNDLGLNGTSTPIQLAQSNGAIDDQIFSTDTAIQIGISGTKKGGALYLDNFQFAGHKSSDSCVLIVNDIKNIHPSNDFLFFENDNQIQISKRGSTMNVELFNVSGKIIRSESVIEIFSFNTSLLPAGIYFLRASSTENNFVKIFSVTR